MSENSFGKASVPAVIMVELIHCGAVATTWSLEAGVELQICALACTAWCCCASESDSK